MNLTKLIRKNIASLKPYSSARNEYSGRDAILLDANENPFNAPLNRYPDPLQSELRIMLSEYFSRKPEEIFIGNGSDEAIDLLYRAFCEPAVDNVIAIDPSYGMYKVCADINDVEYRKASLNEDFSLNIDAVLEKVDEQTKMVFLCSPNNPTSNLLNKSTMLKLANSFQGLVIVDEAYIDFALSDGMLEKTRILENLIVLRTFSKAWGLAGIRIGMAFGDQRIIEILNKIKYPYNINVLSQQQAIHCLKNTGLREKWIHTIVRERKKMELGLKELDFVECIYPSDANFLLMKVNDPQAIYHYLLNAGVVVRDRSNVNLCEGSLRITIGNDEENNMLMALLYEYKSKSE